jgi:FKBP-type peptidyl-prolyl cis-trans isomerases 1
LSDCGITVSCIVILGGQNGQDIFSFQGSGWLCRVFFHLNYPIILLHIFFLLFFSNLESKEGQLYKYSPQSILESFYRDLFENTTAGYVIFGDKPISIEGFSLPEKEIPGTVEHRFSVVSLLALKHWENCIRNKQREIFFISNCNEESRYCELLFINRSQFLRVVKETLLLFQYKFGPKITPEGLLENLKNGFSSVFKEHIALQGVVLGYGVENAISYENVSLVKKHITVHSPVPPYQLPIYSKTEEGTISKIKQSKKDWENIKNDISDFSFYKPTNENDHVKIPFTYHKNSSESNSLINNYRKYQKKIDSLLKNKDFLALVASKLGVKIDSKLYQEDKFYDLSEFFTEDERKLLPFLISQSICATFTDEISPPFFEGMKAADSDVYTRENRETRFLDILRKSRDLSYVNDTNQFLSVVAKQKNIQCLVPKKLYYQVTKAGASDNSVTIHSNSLGINYLISDLMDNQFLGNYKFGDPLDITLDKLIPGLAHGMLGMKKGEVREIFIHPDFVYGISSQFANGKAIKVTIELVSIGEPSEEITLPKLIPFDVINYAPDISSCADFNDLHDKYACYCGFKVWEFYKKSGLELGVILNLINSDSSSTLINRDLLTKFQWILYQKN